MWRLAIPFFVCLFSFNVHAVNKCVGADGRVTFQDAPCAGQGTKIDLKPAAGAYAPAPVKALRTDSAEGEPKAMTEAERIEENTRRLQTERRIKGLEEFHIPQARGELRRHEEECAQKYAALQAKKNRSMNNLAGATWEQSISTEMTALTSMCDSRSRTLAAEVDRLRDTCRSLGGCR